MADTYHHSNILVATRGDVPLKMRLHLILRGQGEVRSPSMELARVADSRSSSVTCITHGVVVLRADSPCWPLVR